MRRALVSAYIRLVTREVLGRLVEVHPRLGDGLDALGHDLSGALGYRLQKFWRDR